MNAIVNKYQKAQAKATKLASQAKASIEAQIARLQKKVANLSRELNTLNLSTPLRDTDTRVYTWDNVGDAIYDALKANGATRRNPMSVAQVISAIRSLPADYTYTDSTISIGLSVFRGRHNKRGHTFEGERSMVKTGRPYYYFVG